MSLPFPSPSVLTVLACTVLIERILAADCLMSQYHVRRLTAKCFTDFTVQSTVPHFTSPVDLHNLKKDVCNRGLNFHCFNDTAANYCRQLGYCQLQESKCCKSICKATPETQVSPHCPATCPKEQTKVCHGITSYLQKLQLHCPYTGPHRCSRGFSASSKWLPFG